MEAVQQNVVTLQTENIRLKDKLFVLQNASKIDKATQINSGIKRVIKREFETVIIESDADEEEWKALIDDEMSMTSGDEQLQITDKFNIKDTMDDFKNKIIAHYVKKREFEHQTKIAQSYQEKYRKYKDKYLNLASDTRQQLLGIERRKIQKMLDLIKVTMEGQDLKEAALKNFTAFKISLQQQLLQIDKEAKADETAVTQKITEQVINEYTGEARFVSFLKLVEPFLPQNKVKEALQHKQFQTEAQTLATTTKEETPVEKKDDKSRVEKLNAKILT